MSDNVVGADNQQGSLLQILLENDPSETTRRAPLQNGEALAYLQRALHDASFNKGKRFRFTQKERAWLELLKLLLSQLGYSSWIYREGKMREVYTLETLATVLDFTFNPLVLGSDIERIAYIRGFFDAEGGIPRSNDAKFYIQLVQKDRIKIEKLKYILFGLNIETGVVHNPSKQVDPEYWRIFIATCSHQRFMQLIGSWHPRKALIFQERMKI